MHQARVFFLVDATSEVLSAALARFSNEVSGDDRIASSPITPTDLLINWRRLKPLSLACTQNPSSLKQKISFDDLSRDQYFAGRTSPHYSN